MNSRITPNYTVGSLFAGVGGICLGFQQAGADVLWANDIDKYACETYRLNFKHPIIEADIHRLNPEELGNVDIITSGFPCQAFSVAGYQKGFHDKRGDLFFETLRFIDTIKPKAILLENVRNLVSHDNGNTIKVIKDYVLHSGYSFIPKILNTMEYGNLPQTRERIYIIGFRDEKIYNELEMHPDAVCSNAFSFPAKLQRTNTIHDVLEKKQVEAEFYYDRFSIYERLKKEVTKHDTLYQWRRMYVRENKSKVCPTLTANMGTGGHNVPLVKDKWGIRKLTPLECFKFQGFPADFKLPAMAKSHLYKQAGNSVSVPVIQRIAENMITALNVKYTASTRKFPRQEMLVV